MGADAENFTECEDREVLVGAMVESREAVEIVEEILSIPHLGFAFVGANDLSISMGQPRETDHPDVREAIETVETACRDADVPLGAPKHDIEAAAAVLDTEYRVLRVGDEFGAVRDILGDRIDALG